MKNHSLTAIGIALTLAIVAILQTPVLADAPPAAKKPGKKDRCAACGMFVAKYPQWVAEVVWSDNTRGYFDGTKCMFRVLQNIAKFKPDTPKLKPVAIHVTNYYTSKPIDGRTAHYVIGSDVLGPMGHELIPFASASDAKEFKADHHGKQILRFDEVTPALIAELRGHKK